MDKEVEVTCSWMYNDEEWPLEVEVADFGMEEKGTCCSSLK